MSTQRHLRIYGAIVLAVGINSAILLSTVPAKAVGLYGSGRTVQAFYYNSTFASPEGEIPVGQSSSDPFPITSEVDYQLGAADGSTIAVTNMQITITNLLSGAPFCLSGNSGASCGDQIDGFDFKFTGENILGASANIASAVGMLPVTGTFLGNDHLGLQLISPNEVQVDLTGDLPLLNDQLIIDLSFEQNVATTPLPAALPLFTTGLGALGLLARRRKRKQIA